LKQNLLSLDQTTDPDAQLVDGSGDVGPEDVRVGEPQMGEPLSNPDIQVVEGHATDPDPHLPGSGLRVGNILEHEALSTTVLVKDDCLHNSHSFIENSNPFFKWLERLALHRDSTCKPSGQKTPEMPGISKNITGQLTFIHFVNK
jgi:hypothetical protein